MKHLFAYPRMLSALIGAVLLAYSGTAIGTPIGNSLPALSAPAASIEVAFSPGPDALNLVIRTIQDARRSIRLAGYSFTSYPVTKALIDAKKKGIDVQVVVDGKHNTELDRSGKAMAALSALANAGIPVRLNGTYAILHDKFIVVDGRTVQTGSFNYSAAAERSNSENVVVIRDHSETASRYLDHWQSRFNEGLPFKTPY